MGRIDNIPLEVFPTYAEADVRMHEYAAKLVEHNAQRKYGVYVAPWGTKAYGVFIKWRREEKGIK